jgi:hypothetical protein
MVRVTDDRCPLCGITRNALQNQPMTDDPTVLERVLDGLQTRLEDLKEGRTSPEHAREELTHLCSGCGGLLAGLTREAAREELIQHLALAVRRVDARLQAMAEDLPPTAEHSNPLRGPGDRVA